MEKLRIAISSWNPWVTFPYDKISLAKGVIIDLYNSMKKANIFEYDLQYGETYGSKGSDNKWTGMIGKIIRNETDLAGPYFLDEAKSKVVEYHAPLYFSELVIVTNLVSTHKDPFLIFGIYTPFVWMILLLSAIIASGVALLIYSVLPAAYKKRKIEVFLRYLWIFHTSLIGNEFGSKRRWFLQHISFSPSFRFLEGVWFITCLVFVYTFQGSIISTYTANKMKPKHQSLDDLLEDTEIQIGTFSNSFPAICLSKLVKTRYEPIWTRAQGKLLGAKDLFGEPVWLDSVEEGKAAFVSESIHTRFLIGERFKATGKCGVRVTPLGVCSTYLGLVSRKNLSKMLVDKVNEGILRFNEAGLARWHISRSLLFYDICTAKSKPKRKPLDLTDLFGAFIVLSAGLLLSLMNFIGEIILGKMYALKKTRNYTSC